MTPTPKQVDYALSLLAKAGYDTQRMNASFKALGATMKERSGPVRAWLEGMDRPSISSLIDTLKAAANG